MPIGPPDPQCRFSDPFDPLWLIPYNRHQVVYNPFMSAIEHAVGAVQKAAGIFPEFPRGLLILRGSDRVRFLHNLVTHDIKGLQAGQARPACLLDRHGKILASFLVLADTDELILEMDPAHLGTAQKSLNQFLISEAVEIADATKNLRILPLHGPASADLLKSVWPGVTLPVENLTHRSGSTETGFLRIVRWDLLRQPGYHLWIAPETKEGVLQQITEKGRGIGLAVAGPEAFDILRIESGVPWPGAEIDETVILNELGIEEMVSFTKGCYIGQEIVARIKYRAHPPRQLTGFSFDSPVLPPLRSPVLLKSKAVGVITSACFSPTLKRGIGLGFLNYGLQERAFQVQTPRGTLQATLTTLPFVP